MQDRVRSAFARIASSLALRKSRNVRNTAEASPTFSLVPQIIAVVNVPVIAAGGIADARGVVAALALGAEAVQMGTVFLACEASGASRLHRETLRRRNAKHTALTKGFTGRLARGIHNRVMEDLNRAGTEILPYPLQRTLVRNLTIAAEAAGRADLVPMWAGQIFSDCLERSDSGIGVGKLRNLPSSTGTCSGASVTANYTRGDTPFFVRLRSMAFGAWDYVPLC